MFDYEISKENVFENDTTLFAIALCFSNFQVIHAEEMKPDRPHVEVSVIDESTGEDVSKYAQVKENPSPNLMTKSTSETFSYEVELSLPDSQITPFATDTVSKEVDAKATLSINYDKRTVSGKNQIRVNRVYGSWTPRNSFIIIENRRVDYQDVYLSHTVTKKPTSNSFTYTTGWGYVEYNRKADIWLRAYAESEANIRISGMGTGYKIHLLVAP